MQQLDLSQKHPGFFDLNYLRQTACDLAGLSDDELMQAVLDPENSTPPNPNSIFDAAHYARQYMSRDAGGPANPICHYLVTGAGEDASPNLLFDPLFFARNAGPAAAQFPTLVECALDRIEIGLSAFHPFIDAAFAQRQLGQPDTSQFLQDLFTGRLDIRQSHPLFDVDYMRDHANRNITDLADAIAWYWQGGGDIATHPLFDVDYYQSNLHADAAIEHSVYHYLISARPAAPQPLFESAFYQTQAQAAGVRVGARPLEHFIAQGQSLGLDPSPFFDVEYYRDVSQCGPDALQHYVVEGHKGFAPHPLIRPSEDKLFARAAPASDLSVATRLACRPQDVPFAVTPDVDPIFLGRVSKAKNPVPNLSRDAYFRLGYSEDKRPNGLLSLPYIAARSAAVEGGEEAILKPYFRQGRHLTKRVVIALETLDDTPDNRGWLTVLQSQLSDPEVEFIIVGGRSGAMVAEFYNVAHVWLLSNQPKPRAPLGTLLQSAKRLAEVTAANAPLVVFAEAKSRADLAKAMCQLDCPLILFDGAGLTEVQGETAPSVATAAAHILCASAQVKAVVDSQFTPRDSCPTSVFNVSPTTAYRAIAPQTDPAETRKKLGLPKDAIVVLGSGPLDLSNSVDLFGAVAGRCLQHPECPPQVHFIWQGAGLQFPNTPAFYATYFVASVADPDRIQIVLQPGLKDLLSVADIYLKFCRDSADLSGLAEAKAAGVPVVLSSDLPDDDPEGTVLVGRFDTEAACDAVLHLVDAAQNRQRHGAAARLGAQTGGALSTLMEQMNAVLSQTGIDIQLAPAPYAPPEQSVLIVADEAIFASLFADHGRVGRYQGLAITTLDPSLLAPDSAFAKQVGPIDLTDIKHAVVCVGTDGLPPGFIAEFGRTVWLVQGMLAQLEEIYRLGIYFDDIRVGNRGLIDEMARLNPRIANVMSVFAGGQP